MNLVDVVYEILKELDLPCNYRTRPEFGDKETVLSYHFFNKRYGLYGDGDGREFVQNLQVDIFTLDDWMETEDKIIELMKQKKIKFSYGNDADEVYKNRPMYHRSLVFNFRESEVIG